VFDALTVERAEPLARFGQPMTEYDTISDAAIP
jgi:hypothetical protein